MKVKQINLNAIHDPMVRSAARVAAAFENLYRAAIVREVGRAEAAILELDEAVQNSLEELHQWAYPKATPIDEEMAMMTPIEVAQ